MLSRAIVTWCLVAFDRLFLANATESTTDVKTGSARTINRTRASGKPWNEACCPMLAETTNRNRKPKTKGAVSTDIIKKKSPQEPERLQPCAILPGSLEGFRVLPAKREQPVIEGHGREGQLYLDLICVCCCAVAGCNAKRKQEQKLTSFAAWEVVQS